jgi:hypothetical protein
VHWTLYVNYSATTLYKLQCHNIMQATVPQHFISCSATRLYKLQCHNIM